jgi:hypothetical protein
MTQVTSSTIVTSFATELAELLIQNETTQSDANRAVRDAARTSFLEDSQHQVDELHSAANSMEAGALAGAALSIAGDACSVAATAYKFDASTTSACDSELVAKYSRDAGYAGDASAFFSGLAAPAKTLIGDAPQKDHEANATHDATLAEQAKWQAGDASAAIDKADKLGDKLLDLVQSLEQAQNSAANAVIGRI